MCVLRDPWMTTLMFLRFRTLRMPQRWSTESITMYFSEMQRKQCSIHLSEANYPENEGGDGWRAHRVLIKLESVTTV